VPLDVALGARSPSEIVSVAVALSQGPAAADARPEQDEEDGLAAPEGGKEAEEEPAEETQAAGSRDVRTFFPPVFEKVLPELGVGAPGSVARNLPGAGTLHTYIQVLLHVVHYVSLPHLNLLHGGCSRVGVLAAVSNSA
jgi:hypothetical protein